MPAYKEYITVAFRYNGIESGNKDGDPGGINCPEALPRVSFHPRAVSYPRRFGSGLAPLHRAYTSQWFTSAFQLTDLPFDTCIEALVMPHLIQAVFTMVSSCLSIFGNANFNRSFFVT